MFSIDEEPTFNALEKLRKAILSTNFVLAKSGKQLVMLPNNYILRNLDRALDNSSSYIDTAYCFYLYGQIFHDEGKYQEATSNYRKAIEIDPLNHYFYLEKGKSLIALGRYKEAVSSFNTAISMEPNNPQVWGERAIAYSFLGDSDEEVKSYGHALCADPNYYQSCYENGILCEELGNKLQAVEYYTRTLKVEPTCAEAYYRRGILNLGMGDPLFNLDYETYRQSARDDLQKAEVLFAQQGKLMPQISYSFVSHSSSIVDVYNLNADFENLISKPKPVTLKYGNQISIKACNDKYVMADLKNYGKLSAKANHTKEWEIFELIDASNPFLDDQDRSVCYGDKIAFQAISNKKFVCSDLGNYGKLSACAPHVKEWETFILLPSQASKKIGQELKDGSTFTLQVHNKQQVKCIVRKGGRIYIGSPHKVIKKWEIFTFKLPSD